MFGSAATIAMAAFLAGCSGNIARFDDGFYTGAVPQTVPVQQSDASQPYPGAVDGMATGGIAPSGNTGGGGFLPSPQSQPYPAAESGQQMERSQLPPPPSYRTSSQVQQSAPVSQPSMPAPAHMASRDGTPITRGAPPSTLQAEAARLAVPQSRPLNERPASTQERRAASRTAAGTITVESGDTLLGIARRTGVSAAAIRQANGMTSDTVRLGQRLTIPAGGTVASQTQIHSRTVAAADTRSRISAPPAAHTATREPAPSVKMAEAKREDSEVTASKSGRIAQAEPKVDKTETGSVKADIARDVAAVAPNSTGISAFRWPVQGRVINRFGEKVDGKRNDGINISVPRGTPVKAAENGVVIYAGNGLKEFGNTVLVKHEDGLVTVYGNAEDLLVKKGDDVRRGQIIAKSGMTGDTTVPILHFEVRKNSAPVNPAQYLQ
ncbi:peptidoglycan DD-metalloendopeptidase family protein [Jiella sp. MQZ9-1]|nr:peptidoglycan DD-metalloendopeptidase family protein [Jiella flava]